MLTRREETANAERDEFDCFQTTVSQPYRPLFLKRPPVKEGVEILWAGKRKCWLGFGPQGNYSGRKPCRGTRARAKPVPLWGSCG